MLTRTFALLLVVLVVAPLHAQKPGEKPKARPSAAGRKMGLAKPIVFKKDYEVYGSKLKAKKLVSLGKIAKGRKKWDGKNVQVRGKITGVCPKKGCWMMVQDGQEKLRVRFTDYSFFVPLDCTGREVTTEGRVTVRIETEAERRHYAEDAGKSKAEIEKIKGDKAILSFEADAVRIGKPPAKPKKKAKKLAPKKG